MKSTKWLLLTFAFAALLMAGACKKRVAPTPPPPPPPPPAPTATLSVSPSSIEKGSTATLTWTSTNATEVSIEGVGVVEANGSKEVKPEASTNYTLAAKGPGGETSANARITVTLPPPPPPPAPVVKGPTEEELFAQNIKDIFFDYDKAELREADKATIAADAAFLSAHAGVNFVIGGYADERGSTEYNLTLSGKRADSVKAALVAAGIAESRIKTIPYGKEKPFCTDNNEACWQQNRRGNFVFGK